jgi:diphthine-ammonia ligase
VQLLILAIQGQHRWAIIAVEREKLGRERLGYTFRSVEDLEKFLRANPHVDPIGEAGEFHTIVLESPLFRERLEIKIKSFEESERYWWVRFGLVRE